MVTETVFGKFFQDFLKKSKKEAKTLNIASGEKGYPVGFLIYYILAGRANQ